MSFFEELKRRNVIRVGIAYAVGAWLVAQAADLVLDVMGAPDIILRSLVAILAVCFIPALIFAWAFEITPEGIKKEKEVNRTQSITHHTAKKLDIATMVLLVAAIALVAADRFVPHVGGRSAADNRAQSALLQDGTNSPNVGVRSADDNRTGSALLQDRKSIAVLPFANRSADADESTFFSDGIHDDLLTHLSKIRELKVISRTSVMGYRDTEKNMRQIGEELGVANILEGGVQRAGNRVRINAQLIDAQTDEHIWAEIFDRELTAENIFDIQQDISLAIAAALEAELSTQEQDDLAAVPTNDLVAYEQYLAARQLAYRSTVESWHKASQMLQDIVVRDPRFAQAYTELAGVEINLVSTGAKPLEEARELVETSMARALELDPRNGTAWATKGAWAVFNGQFTSAEELFEKGLELSPGDADVRGSYGYYLVKFKGRPDLALPQMQKAVELDPLAGFWIFTLGRVYDGMERKEEALALYGRARDIEPNSGIGYSSVAGLVGAKGQVAESLDWNLQAMERDSLDVELKANHAFSLMTLGDLNEADSWLQQAERESNDDQPLPMAARIIWNSMSGKSEAANELARFVLKAELPDRWGSDAIVLRALRNEALSKGNLADALAAFQKRHPNLFTASPEITIQNILQAVDLSSLWINSGKTEQAETLLKAVITAFDQPYFATGSYVSWIVPAKAQALALLGRHEEAIAELQRVVQKGWRISWQWETDLNSNFDSLRGDPRYQEIIDFLRDDAEEQRQEYLNQQT